MKSEPLPRVALVGMPNVGKTALFNKLTGSFQRVANFPGVTVEKKNGWIYEGSQRILEVIDLPGIYSLDATTLDEKVTKDFLLGKDSTSKIFVLVLDATNLDKSLFLAFQLKELGYPLLIALNLMDEARKRNLNLNLDKMAKELNAIIIPTSASTGDGVKALISAIMTNLERTEEITLTLPGDAQKVFRSPAYVSAIFQKIDKLLEAVTITPLKPDSFSEKIDRIVLHPVLGVVTLFLLLMAMFQTLFSWASPLQDLIEASFLFLGTLASTYLTNDLLKSLIVDGIISGVGGVVVFLPQIVLLFLFIQFLEDLGYLGRAAFLMDSLMRRIGLPGKSVIPLLSSHACAIPGILSTRVIDNHRERLITMLVIPLTTCSARLPVYAILIGALIPDIALPGVSFIRLPGLVLFSLYVLGFSSAMLVALIFKKTLPHPSPSMLLMELPPYRVPKLKNLIQVMKNKASLFLRKAGGIILLVSIVIWALVTFPRQEGISSIDQSYAAMIGRLFVPLFDPLGFDWRITTALIPSIGAREVVVSALSLVLSVEGENEARMTQALLQYFGVETLAALLVWFIFAPQCISTFAVMKRETNSYRWPLLMVGYTLALAYLFAFLARQLVLIWS
jgi:ferrous iron transport protein B